MQFQSHYIVSLFPHAERCFAILHNSSAVAANYIDGNVISWEPSHGFMEAQTRHKKFFWTYHCETRFDPGDLVGTFAFSRTVS